MTVRNMNIYWRVEDIKESGSSSSGCDNGTAMVFFRKVIIEQMDVTRGRGEWGDGQNRGREVRNTGFQLGNKSWEWE